MRGLKTADVWGLLLAAAGLVLLGLAWRASAAHTTDANVAALLGRPREGTVAPWVLGGAGALCLVVAGVALWAGSRRPRVPAGWHDDPDDPRRLRYHDGTGWTQRTADKS